MGHMFEQETTFSFIAKRLKEIQAQEWEAVRTPEKEPVVTPAVEHPPEAWVGDYCD
jgi:hypothetical protein